MTEQKEETKPDQAAHPVDHGAPSAAAAKSSDATQVRQKFSHGRTRAVTVEVKKPVKRTAGRGHAGGAVAGAALPEAPAAAADRSHPEAGRQRRHAAAAAAPGDVRPRRGEWRRTRRRGIVLRTLTEEEKEARARALVGANRDAEARASAPPRTPARRAVEDEARKKADDEHKKRLAEEEARKKAEEEVKRKADALVQKRLDQAATRLAADHGCAPGPGDRDRRAGGLRRRAARHPPSARALGQTDRCRRCAGRRCGRPSTSACRSRRARAARCPSAAPTRSTSAARSRARTISAAGRRRSMRRRLERDRRREHARRRRSRRSIARSRSPRPSRSRSSPRACPSAAPTSSRR